MVDLGLQNAERVADSPGKLPTINVMDEDMRRNVTKLGKGSIIDKR